PLRRRRVAGAALGHSNRRRAADRPRHVASRDGRRPALLKRWHGSRGSDGDADPDGLLTWPGAAVPTFAFDPSVSWAIEGSPDSDAKEPDVSGWLAREALEEIHRYWMAANYLTVGQIFLQENPPLREPLRAEHIKPRLLGHWGTSPGQNLI